MVPSRRGRPAAVSGSACSFRYWHLSSGSVETASVARGREQRALQLLYAGLGTLPCRCAASRHQRRQPRQRRRSALRPSPSSPAPSSGCSSWRACSRRRDSGSSTLAGSRSAASRARRSRSVKSVTLFHFWSTARSSPARGTRSSSATGLPTARISPDEVSKLFRGDAVGPALKEESLTDPSLQPRVAAISTGDMSDT